MPRTRLWPSQHCTREFASTYYGILSFRSADQEGSQAKEYQGPRRGDIHTASSLQKANAS